LAAPFDCAIQLPPNWQREVRRQLEPGEVVLAWFEPDLDAQLRYAKGLVVVTDRRVLTTTAASSESTDDHGAPSAEATRWRSWPLDSITELGAVGQAGVGTLELLTTGQRLAHWHYTLGRSSNADRLVQHFTTVRRGALSRRLEGALAESGKNCCPDCGAELVVACPACGETIESVMQVDCRACGTPLRPAELFGTVIRRKAEPASTPIVDDDA